MFSWFNNPQSVFVLAAYGVAAVLLLALLLVSWREGRERAAEGRRLQGRRSKKS